jgi:hypothetical protein
MDYQQIKAKKRVKVQQQREKNYSYSYNKYRNDISKIIKNIIYIYIYIYIKYGVIINSNHPQADTITIIFRPGPVQGPGPGF